jgi:hypothetical protein
LGSLSLEQAVKTSAIVRSEKRFMGTPVKKRIEAV